MQIRVHSRSLAVSLVFFPKSSVEYAKTTTARIKNRSGPLQCIYFFAGLYFITYTKPNISNNTPHQRSACNP